MLSSFISLAAICLISLTSAVPTPAELAPRCGTTLYPSKIQLLSEELPLKSFPKTNNFFVKQESSSSKRTYALVQFDKVPTDAYACQLNVKFPGGYYIGNVGNPTLNVTTLFKDQPKPRNISWKTLYPTARQSPLGQGLFGTVNLTPGQTTAINSESCPAPAAKGSLAYVFSIARWIEGEAYVYTSQQDPKAGFYLTFNC
ncbi:hypothetical protein HYFRA_00012861 [Hymenoscyphus fraxineus]|uniref:Ubiquitin 3 binding protein But2 C-terminal domain-containing protein n=1 Tax=Hymenoscyphus fraxineus TaxID=746836 RepID=A0A9N9L2M7_9HELO|nr:hypothetical protein HYFRA_00012861 [Hymenoscyphus fraxineus]